MRIAVVGAGAIGGWLTCRLARAGNSVSVLARGATLDAIRRDGLSVSEGDTTRTTRLPASDSPSALGPQDLVIVAVKGPALASVAPIIAELLGPETAVLPAMNGVQWWFTHGLKSPLKDRPLQSVDPDGAIAAQIPPSRVIGCVVHASAYTARPAAIVHTNGRRLIVVEPCGGTSVRLSRVVELLRLAELDIVMSGQIQQDVWYKLWGNMTMNPISALTRATTDRILDDPLVRSLALAVMTEARDVGARIGCAISESGEDRMAVTRRLGAIKTSMLQDVEAGRPLEIDALLAAPREIAQNVGVPTPCMDTLHGLIRLFDSTRGAQNA